MAYSQASLIQRVRDIVQDMPWATPFTATIASTTSTTVTVADGTLWDQGSVGEFQDNGEQFYVRSVAGNNLTVFRGWNGSTAATHDGSSTPIVIYKDMVMSYKRIVDAVELTMQDLWPYAWKLSTTSITPQPGSRNWYDLTTTFIDPISVLQLDSASPTNVWYYGSSNLGISTAGPVPMPPLGFRRVLPVTYQHNLPASLCASGNGMSFPQGTFDNSNTITVNYRALITNATNSGNYTDVSDGLLADLLAYGAAARLTRQSEIPRDTATAVSMGDSSVAPGMRTRAGQDLFVEFVRLRKSYYEYLSKTIPPMSTWTRG